MGNTRLLTAAAAVVLLAMPAARAADLPPLPPPMYHQAPVAEYSGWYLRGDIGMTNQSVGSLDNVVSPGTTVSTKFLTFDSAPFFGVGLGYQLNNWLRFDVTGEYRAKSHFHGQQVATFGAIILPDDYHASKSEWLFLANAYVDLGTWWCVTPFIGAGVGFSRNTISSYVDTNTPTGGVAIAPAASKWNLAWALHTGLAYRVNPGFTVELGYSYVNLGDATTGIVSDFTGFANNHTMGFKDITSHDLTLGVRWNLDSPTVYAPPPPPVVRKG